jgi:hypothetical protein
MENLHRAVPGVEPGRRAVDGAARHVSRQRLTAISHRALYVEQTPKNRIPHGHRDRAACPPDLGTASKPGGEIKRDCAHCFGIEMRLHLYQNLALAGAVNQQSLMQGREAASGKGNVHHCAAHGGDMSEWPQVQRHFSGSCERLQAMSREWRHLRN